MSLKGRLTAGSRDGGMNFGNPEGPSHFSARPVSSNQAPRATLSLRPGPRVATLAKKPSTTFPILKPPAFRTEHGVYVCK